MWQWIIFFQNGILDEGCLFKTYLRWIGFNTCMTHQSKLINTFWLTEAQPNWEIIIYNRKTTTLWFFRIEAPAAELQSYMKPQSRLVLARGSPRRGEHSTKFVLRRLRLPRINAGTLSKAESSKCKDRTPHPRGSKSVLSVSLSP